MKPRLIRGVFFLWVAVPIVLYILYWAFGLPHMIWTYRFIANGARYDLDVPRIYTSCTYVGFYGSFTRPAQHGKCGYIKFFFKDAEVGHAR